jgi:hypothetical protein
LHLSCPKTLSLIPKTYRVIGILEALRVKLVHRNRKALESLLINYQQLRAILNLAISGGAFTVQKPIALFKLQPTWKLKYLDPSIVQQNLIHHFQILIKKKLAPRTTSHTTVTEATLTSTTTLTTEIGRSTVIEPTGILKSMILR